MGGRLPGGATSARLGRPIFRRHPGESGKLDPGKMNAEREIIAYAQELFKGGPSQSLEAEGV